MEFNIALDDDLLLELHNFKHSKSCDSRKIEALLHFYKPPHITNVAQLNRVGITDKGLISQLAQQSWPKDDLESLSKKTIYKLILGTEKNSFPYVNVFNDDFEMNYTSTSIGKNRDKVKEHIKALLEDAKSVFIYDKYFKENWRDTKNFFVEILPRKPMTIFYKENHFEQKEITEARKIFDWNFHKDKSHKNYKKLHDRYLIIDDKIEIILTSGFANLFDVTTDLSVVIRKKV
jgi:hypothetical protein